jgi:hypothetical protein
LRLDLDVSEAEPQSRHARLAPAPPAEELGGLGNCRETVRPLSKAAVLFR